MITLGETANPPGVDALGVVTGARVAEPTSSSTGVTRARARAAVAVRGRSPPAGRLPRSSATSRSCSEKSSLIRPSTHALCTVPVVSTSTTRAVIRSRSPTRWYPPPTSHRAPSRRAASMVARSSPSARSPPDGDSRAADTELCPITMSPPARSRSAVSVSAMPAPIHSSAGAPEMLANTRTATRAAELGAAATGDCDAPAADVAAGRVPSRGSAASTVDVDSTSATVAARLAVTDTLRRHHNLQRLCG